MPVFFCDFGSQTPFIPAWNPVESLKTGYFTESHPRSDPRTGKEIPAVKSNKALEATRIAGRCGSREGAIDPRALTRTFFAPSALPLFGENAGGNRSANGPRKTGEFRGRITGMGTDAAPPAGGVQIGSTGQTGGEADGRRPCGFYQQRVDYAGCRSEEESLFWFTAPGVWTPLYSSALGSGSRLSPPA